MAALGSMLVRQMLKDSHVFGGNDAGAAQAQDAFVDVVADAVSRSMALRAAPPPGHGAAPPQHTQIARAEFDADFDADFDGGLEDVVGGHGRVSSGFGPRVDPFTHKASFHHGVDVAAPKGSPIHALAGGRVVVAGPVKGYGNLVEVEGDDGQRVRYAHADRVDVAVGDVVEKGQALATVGSTGRSTGPHVHIEVRDDGAAVDPETALLLARSAR